MVNVKYNARYGAVAASGGTCDGARKDERSRKRCAFLTHALVHFDVRFACRPWAAMACRIYGAIFARVMTRDLTSEPDGVLPELGRLLGSMGSYSEKCILPSIAR